MSKELARNLKIMGRHQERAERRASDTELHDPSKRPSSKDKSLRRKREKIAHSMRGLRPGSNADAFERLTGKKI